MSNGDEDGGSEGVSDRVALYDDPAKKRLLSSAGD
jgi:hypothetical protein